MPEDLFREIDNFNIILTNIDKNNEEGENIIEKIKNKKTLGYVSFSFFCGEACYWSAVIEIMKVNGKRAENREIAGLIA